jgi:hypothetical protein
MITHNWKTEKKEKLKNFVDKLVENPLLSVAGENL